MKPRSKHSRLLIVTAWQVYVGIAGCVPPFPSEDSTKAADDYALKIVRGGGLPPPNAPKAEFEHYVFTAAQDGKWEFRYGVFEKRGMMSGSISTTELKRWIKDIEHDGFHRLESNPNLGGADEGYLDVTILSEGKQLQKRIDMGENLSHAIHKKVLEVTKLVPAGR